ncbi:putative DNA-binding domain-containing protein [Glaciecola siphonariae]|uniref:DNA-binding domain-containing protein n=1 Tax=Glaciecola siphonariae TaxID=521012 RepID=A0ABV9LW44_9ALTE
MDYQKQLIDDIFNPSASSHRLPGVQIYHNNFVENGIRALSITFPTLAHLMDEGDFRALARAYLLSDIKTEFDWADYGDGLADFLMRQEQVSALPYLSEVAELDWLLHQVSRKADKTFDAESFALLNEQNPAALEFELAPGFTLAKFFFPVEQLYRLAHDAELRVAGATRDQFIQQLNKSISDAINLDTPRSIMLWRPDYKAEMLSLNDHDAIVFQQLQNKRSVADIFAHFTDQVDHLQAWLSEQIMQKRIYGLRSHN